MDAYKLDEKQVKLAVKTLKKLHNKWVQEKPDRKQPLFEDPDDIEIFLQVTLKKIPVVQGIQMIKIPLPNSLVTDNTDVCLITGDLDKKNRKAEIEPTVLHYKDLLSKHGVKCISEVISLRQLRTEYKPYEAKRQLCGGYDIFLTDAKIAGCLPRVLGKFFFKKRKFPQQIDLKAPNLKNEIENALSKTVVFLSGHGGSCSTQVARLGQSNKQIVENIIASVKVLATKLPGNWPNINGLYIKLPKSAAIPFYISFDSGNNVELSSTEDIEIPDAEDFTTLKRSKVKVFPTGEVEIISDEEIQLSESESDFETRLLSEEKELKRRKIAQKKNNDLRMKRKEKKLKKLRKSNLHESGSDSSGIKHKTNVLNDTLGRQEKILETS